jgi:hypothetical protein
MEPHLARELSWYVWSVLVTFPTALLIIGLVWKYCTCSLCGKVCLPKSLVKVVNPYYARIIEYRRFCNHCLLPKILSEEIDLKRGKTKALFKYPFKYEQASAFGGRASGV